MAFLASAHRASAPQYRPQLFIRTSDVTVSLSHLPGTEDADEKMVMPGDSIELVGELVHDVALEEGSRFTLREGGKTGELWPRLPHNSSSTDTRLQSARAS